MKSIRNLDPSKFAAIQNGNGLVDPTSADIDPISPGPNLASVGTVSGSWTSPVFDISDVDHVSVQLSQSGSIVSGSAGYSVELSGTISIQVTNDIGLPKTYMLNKVGYLNCSSSVGGPVGNFFNWCTIFTSQVLMGVTSSFWPLTFEQSCARAMRVLYTPTTGSGPQVLSVATKSTSQG